MQYFIGTRIDSLPWYSKPFLMLDRKRYNVFCHKYYNLKWLPIGTYWYLFIKPAGQLSMTILIFVGRWKIQYFAYIWFSKLLRNFNAFMC